MGQVVIDSDQPCVWIKGLMPFHVTDSSKLRICCPERYRKYAPRAEGYVPIWREKVQFEPRHNRIALANYYSMPACRDGSECPPALLN
eukprot:1233718-Karenia_brevis.AAC.1